MTTEATERDELAMELFIADNFMQPREQSIIDWEWFNETPRFTVRVERYKDQAARILAAHSDTGTEWGVRFEGGGVQGGWRSRESLAPALKYPRAVGVVSRQVTEWREAK